MAQRVIKFSLGLLAMVLVGFGVLYMLLFFDSQYSQQAQ